MWQPIPAPTSVPSGAGVELLCGQPLQKNGVRDIGSGRIMYRDAVSILATRASRSSSRDPSPDARREGDGDLVGEQLSLRMQQRPLVLVELADDLRGIRGPVEQMLDLLLHERQLLLDDDDLLELRGELAHGFAVQRPWHAHVQQPDPAALERRLVEAEQVQRAAQLAVGAAGGHDPEPGVAARAADLVEPVDAGVLARDLKAHVQQRALERQRVGGQEQTVGLVHERSAVELDLGQDRQHALAADLGGPGRVGDRRHDLHRRPQAAGAREGDGVATEVQHLLDR